MRNWQGKKVLVIGAARQGLAAARYLAGKEASVVINDARPKESFGKVIKELENLNIASHFGDHPTSLLKDIDSICISGGVPLTLPIIQEALKSGIHLTNDSQIFMEVAKAKIIGITGSAGKTTTTVLIGAIAQAQVEKNQKVWVGGNIGDPLINYVDDIQPDDWVIIELSSFQLEQMDISPHIAVVLNITPNHLDRHGTMSAYTAAKSRILAYQGKNDICVLNREDTRSKDLFTLVSGKLITFGMDRPQNYNGVFSNNGEIIFADGKNETTLVEKDILQLPGKHNFFNALAACAAGIAAGFKPKAMQEGIRSVKGIPHRLELVHEIGGIRWINDSIATAPERVIAALHAIEQPLVLLLGGRDKDLPWEPLAALMHDKKPKTILFGEAADLIESEILQFEKGNPVYPLYKKDTFEEAFFKAVEISEPGETVLLSPGGNSYDAYHDFEERGEHFRSLVKGLA